MDRRFENQTAIVTGGADGIGRSIAARLGREGGDVILFDADEAKLEETVVAFAADGLTAHPLAVDVSGEDAVRNAFARVIADHGSPDVVVHCAGIVGPNAKKITEVDAADFDRVSAVNLRGSFLVTKHALLAMGPQQYGRVLLFASIAGKEGNAGMVAYSATKAGVIGLVKSAGKDFAESGITVNAIAPAVIRTAMVDAMDEWQVNYMTDKIPMKRCGTLDEVTALACWIVSPEASFNTGAVFDLTGGRATY